MEENQSKRLNGLFRPEFNLNNDAAAQIAAVMLESANKQAEMLALCLQEQARATEAVLSGLQDVVSRLESVAQQGPPEVKVDGTTVNMPERRPFTIEIDGPNGTLTGTVTPEADH